MNTQIPDHKLSSRNIQPTAMRLRVVNYMIQHKAAISLADLEQEFTRSDRTTLYRTLKTFEEHGLVHQINDEGGSTKYALCSDGCTCTYPDDTHVHFHCSSCDETFCFPDLSAPKVNLPAGFNASSGNFVINGTCSPCAS